MSAELCRSLPQETIWQRSAFNRSMSATSSGPAPKQATRVQSAAREEEGSFLKILALDVLAASKWASLVEFFRFYETLSVYRKH